MKNSTDAADDGPTPDALREKIRDKAREWNACPKDNRVRHVWVAAAKETLLAADTRARDCPLLLGLERELKARSVACR